MNPQTTHSASQAASPAVLAAVTLLARVRQRLERDGSQVELHQFARLSLDELDLIVWQEAGCG